MNTELMVIIDFMKYGKTHADHRQTIIDLEEAIRLLHEAQAHIGQADEKEAWTALFTHGSQSVRHFVTLRREQDWFN
jgi:hypothetical protein